MLSSDSRAKLKRSRGTTTIVARLGTSRRLLGRLTIDKGRRRVGRARWAATGVPRSLAGDRRAAIRGAAVVACLVAAAVDRARWRVDAHLALSVRDVFRHG